MKQTSLIAVFLWFLVTLRAQDTITFSQDDFNNLELMRTLNNYQGCKIWTEGICTQCSSHYYFNKRGVCCQVKPECKQFNRETGLCEDCYRGFDLRNGSCSIIDLPSSKDRGCRRWEDGVCVECSISWYLGSNNVCNPVDDFCKTWKDNGDCLQCYNGYVNGLDNRCILNPQPFIPAPDSLCAEWKDRVCLKCAPRSYFDQTGKCAQVDKFCNTWDRFDGQCLICYRGYQLKNRACVLSQPTLSLDSGCKIWDWDLQRCLECSARFVFGAEGTCIPVSSTCNTFNRRGVCTSCFKGYSLKDGACTLAEVKLPVDPGCKIWDWDLQRCLECSARFVFNGGACVKVGDQCFSYNAQGACTGCYKGYTLRNGKCEIHNILCKESSGNGTCVKCYPGYVLFRAQCVPMSKLATLSQYYQECCPEKLSQLRKENRIVG